MGLWFMIEKFRGSPLHKAETNLWNVSLMFSALTGDEEQINAIAYNLQQALEKTVKHQLETKGVRYEFTHSLAALLKCDKDVKNSVDVKLQMELLQISDWKANTRYIKGYISDLNDVKRCYELIKDHFNKVLQQEIDKLSSDKKIEDTKTTEFSGVIDQR